MKANNKNSVSQALIDLDELKKTYLNESKNAIKSILAESVKDALASSIEDDDKDEEYTISDENSAEESDGMDVEKDEKDDAEGCEGGECPMSDDDASDESDSNEEEESDDDKFSEFDEYKNDDGAFDFSGVKDDAADEAIIKVYKLLKNSDQVIVKKDGDRAELKDNETGAEYVIDFGDGEVEKVDDGEDAVNAEPEQEESSEEDDNNLFEVELGDLRELDSEEDDEDVKDPEEDAEGPNGVEPNDDEEFMAENKNKKARKTVMKENKNKVLFEVDLGYTDNCQSKDPVEGLSAEEPAKNKNDWDAGVPKGTKKPWAGKGDSAPFDTKAKNDLNEEDELGLESGAEMPEMNDEVAGLEEAATSISTQADRKTTKSHKPQNKKLPKVSKEISQKGKFVGKVNESPEYQALYKNYQKLLKENKILKNAANSMKNTIEECVLLNVNLGQCFKLIQENSTTKAERYDMINRFDKVKSLDESKALYESMSREFASTRKSNITLEEKQMTAAGTQKLNESKVYENPAFADIRSMMSRMDKKNFI